MSAHKPLDARARVRLARLLGLLGSAFDGEVVNAGRAADRLVKGAGLTWTDLIVGGVAKAEQRPKKPPKARRTAPTPPERAMWRETAEQIVESGCATPWELSFCESLLRNWRGRRLSEKQATTLEAIWVQRVLEAA